jgi:hypothetical protein
MLREWLKRLVARRIAIIQFSVQLIDEKAH